MYYEKKREGGTNAKNRKYHCGYSEIPAAEKKRENRDKTKLKNACNVFSADNKNMSSPFL
jgi:hypothetical protein